LKSELAVLRIEINANKSVIHETKSIIPIGVEAQVVQVGKPIDKLRSLSQQLSSEFHKKDATYQQLFASLRDKNADLRIEFHSTLIDMEAKAKALPTTDAD
jgi:hypothetical protein